MGLGVATMRMGDRCRDGKAEAGARAVAGPAAEAAERLEQPGYLVGGDVLAAIGDGEFGGACVCSGAGQYPAAGIDADRFRGVLRELRNLVPMDVLEHSDGTWEIVFGLPYTNPPEPPQPRPAEDRDDIGGVNPFTMPGWESYSTWGLDQPLGLTDQGYLYAQLYLNTDNPGAAPRIWITPPRYAPVTLDQLAQAIATEIAPYEPVPMPPSAIRLWLVQ